MLKVLSIVPPLNSCVRLEENILIKWLNGCYLFSGHILRSVMIVIMLSWLKYAEEERERETHQVEMDTLGLQSVIINYVQIKICRRGERERE